MIPFIQPLHIRWSDLDANFHLRHSVYYDYAAFARMQYLQQHAITAQFMQEHHFGPIIFREEALFKKEIKMEDAIYINLELIKATPGFDRWTIQHHVYKNDNILAAIITVDGAWLDTIKRKLTVPPEKAVQTFEAMPRPVTFEWIIKP
jgi:acyl-CoA thioester hydrolase